MDVTDLLALTARLAHRDQRPEAAAGWAQRLGAEAVFVFVRDPELGVLVPAPGFKRTRPGGPSWRTLLEACTSAGTRAGQVAYPDERTLRPAQAITLEQGGTFVFVGVPRAIEPEERDALEIAGALFSAEQVAVIASAAATAAREAARHASELTQALDTVRTQLEGTLGEAGRLNGELTRAVAGEREARAQAETASRAKDEFLAMLGHELRNPLAPIVTALHLLRQRGGMDSREHEIIERQVEHVVRLVDDLLDVSRITRGKAELVRSRVDLAQVISSAAEISLTAVRVGELVEISVRDNGVGIEPELLPNVFELFVQGARSNDRAEGGLGLGLALVKNLVAMHDGTVEARSDGAGRGTEVIVRLPALHSDAVPVPRTVAPRVATENRLRLMVVDDNEDAAELLADLLRRRGHEVTIAHDGAQALGLVDEATPDAAILDIGLPVMDGYELARQLRGRPSARSTRLIALTGYGQATDRALAEAAGFDAHLVKPVKFDELLRLLTPTAA